MRAVTLRLVVLTTAAFMVLVPFADHAGAAVHQRATITLPTVYEGYGPTHLVDATCPTTELCLAIGDESAPAESAYSLLYRSTDGGQIWTPSAVPGGVLSDAYDWEQGSVAISCGTPTFCVLEYVGIRDDAPADLYEVTTDGGVSWTEESYLYFDDDQTTGMTSLTCVASETCLGILNGQVASTTNGAVSWTVHHGTHDADSLSCPTAGDCDVLETSAVGHADTLVVARTTDLGATLATVLTVHGTGWRGPSALSCAAAADCVALVPRATDPQLVSTTDGGRRWTTHDAPEPAAIPVEAIECTSVNDCVVLAVDPQHRSTIDSYSTTDGGAQWSEATVWVLGYRGAAPSLSCAATQCVVTLGTRSVFSLDLAAQGTTTWTASRETASTPTLNEVACETNGDCLAVGSGERATSLDDGDSWTMQPDAALAGDSLDSLTCPLPSTCFAAGSASQGAASSGIVLVTTDLGANWTSATVPWEVGGVSDVQCNSLGTCLALPRFTNALAHVPTFVLQSTDGGSDWSLVQVAPASAGLSLTGVSCPTTSCLAVGTEAGVAAVETSSDGGDTWSAVDPTTGGFSGLGEFFGIACSSVSDCQTSAQSADGSQVDAWGTTDTGSSWSLLGTMLTVPEAQSWSTSPMLSACSSGGVCAGYSLNSVGPERPTLYDTVVASAGGGGSWDTFTPPAWVLSVTVAPNGSVIALGVNAEDGTVLVAGSA